MEIASGQAFTSFFIFNHLQDDQSLLKKKIYIYIILQNEKREAKINSNNTFYV